MWGRGVAGARVQARGRIAYLAKHQRIAERATGGKLHDKADAKGKTSAKAGMKKARATTSLEGEDDAEDAEGEEPLSLRPVDG